MKIHSYITTIFTLLVLPTACNNKTSLDSQLKVENDSLKQEILTLKTQIKLTDSLKKYTSKVTIANTDVKELTSKFNNQKYQIKISYPKNYFKNSTKRYPVLYVIDAETNFGGISYIVQRLIKDKLIPEILVVGIAYNTDYKNFYRLRSRDLTPLEDKGLKMGNHRVDPTGGAPKFSDFLKFELFPFIEKEYRIKKEDRAIYGHSYGGLYGSYALLDRPNLFNRYLLLGPSLWYKDKLLVNQVSNQKLSFNKTTKLYMGSGEFDLRIKDYQEEFVNLLQKKNISNLKIKSEVVKNETHRTIFGVGFTNGLRFIYTQ
ncbi:alpha/beta hydrolase [Tenacibaculum agarivorans]|uniref:alpha/beta hydrolase n=1 Tax=Tenacibaculum agarivorans TaxID=1908389 RepID=UPI00094B89AC|nr:alpha/beta hydrolase-fold protein [Tenacibaculum agarivorans]